MSAPIKVLIVDDSAVVRQVLSVMLGADPALQVIGVAPDPIVAWDRMANDWPDVIVLDIEMPRMDGLTFLRKIMAERPTRVLICSTLAGQGAEVTMQALAAGAIGYVTKPTLGLKDFLSASAQEMIKTIKQAARATPRRIAAAAAQAVAASPVPLAARSDKVIAIGTSTGGTQALEALLTSLPRSTPGIVIVQHMPEKFTAMFAQRLNGLCGMEVREARHGDRVLLGRVLIAPGGKHMRLASDGAYYTVEVLDGPPVNCHKPSVDVLFKSVAQVARDAALGIILTGMGDDGARGLRDMHRMGARTLAQDEATCVVYGMPKEAVKLGAVDRELPLEQIGPELLRYCGNA
ncbi:protein-glutamate methylesterase/protein-glutamine glutaminase [Rugamonas apoptosis]|uniref:Protein-glutamate methylesterase/protein-glutamine glutaminase n=1 Tax=Rugamonas apoptosis TaxID=2758570 RepID=A0A7W2IJP8_9BURK|nr:chemotaxis response regulator protein-glutamate methylesterase [Rugamonas apoptosis]MBA5686985.1 chemotaxis response regulator protein-glutamate methylesterase [Rugamonas apoptosis]